MNRGAIPRRLRRFHILHPAPHGGILKGYPAACGGEVHSACSANKLVIEAAIERALNSHDYVLIEATANQVNQYGGYTGMKPADFRNFVSEIAQKTGFPENMIILGGDHLGPLPWKDLCAQKAMEESKELVRQFVMAGFTKIHIDTSMRLEDDDRNCRLGSDVIAERAAVLVQTAEKAFSQLSRIQPKALQPVYVVGSEVPIPGGSQDSEELRVTYVSDFKETVDVFKYVFYSFNLQQAWENVVAVVVQPGVEFGENSIHGYDREKAKELSMALKEYPNLVFEGHSTDYQSPLVLKEMVEDGIAILKVGPALTFALREALVSMNIIENELFSDGGRVTLSRFSEVLNREMLRNDQYWKNHYHGNETELRLARKYSFSDRCRYYLPSKAVNGAIDTLFKNLQAVRIPLTLISQYMPYQYAKLRLGEIRDDPLSLAKDRIKNCIDEYLCATKPSL